jgi:hypothetical protein
MSKAEDAKMHFAANISTLNPSTDREKYYLYLGLMSLAEATDDLHRDIQAIAHEIRNK